MPSVCLAAYLSVYERIRIENVSLYTYIYAHICHKHTYECVYVCMKVYIYLHMCIEISLPLSVSLSVSVPVSLSLSLCISPCPLEGCAQNGITTQGVEKMQKLLRTVTHLVPHHSTERSFDAYSPAQESSTLP